MRKPSKKVVKPDGTIVRVPIKLEKKLNYEIAQILNNAQLTLYDLPIHHCNIDILPDFIALNTEKHLYNKTPLTAVAFFSYDNTFDKIDGLYNAIYYNNKPLLTMYKEQFKDVQYIIAPDYSLFDDIWYYENTYRLFKIRVIMLWFTQETNAIVIPNAIYLSPHKLPFFLDGLENCNTMCFSTKSHMRSSEDRQRLTDTIKYVVDNLYLQHIIVYSVSTSDETVLKLFSYATSKGIDVRIIDNTLRQQNMKKAKVWPYE